jgi:hypothetical protein
MDKFSLCIQTVVRLELQHFIPQTASQDKDYRGDVMDCVTIEQAETRAVSKPSLWLSELARTLVRRIVRRERLDLEGMPDRVKRDLGFLDGREPRYEAEPWR